MEDGPDGISSSALTNNGEIHSVMANFPEVELEQKSPEVNGKDISEICSDQNTDSSDCDALVIDESVKPKTTKHNISSSLETSSGFRGFEKVENYTSKIINAIIYEKLNNLISAQQKLKREIKQVTKAVINVNDKQSEALKKSDANLKPVETKKSNPKLREYAQYLGLQPTVQFKCSKCFLSGFLSLPSLNEHLSQCNTRSPITQRVLSNPNTPTTNFRVTRKVFLCSACGTYYENWNLFLHMREVHKRFICLYCLGMFSHSEKLSLHLTSKHNCNPNNINSVEDFFNIYKDPCFLMCCDCEKVFTESDNFFNHNCIQSTEVHVEKKNTTNIKHVTGDNSLVCDNQVAEQDAASDSSHAKNDIVTTDSLDFQPSLVPMDTEPEHNINQSIGTSEVSNEITDVNVKEEDDTLLKSPCSNNTTMEQENKAVEFDSDSDRMLHEEKEDEDETKPDLNDIYEKVNDTATLLDDLVENSVPEQNSLPKLEVDVRKVPKVTLKLPKQITYDENEDEKEYSDDSDKLTMEVDMADSDTEAIPDNTHNSISDEATLDTSLQIAGADVPIIELKLEQPLDKFESRILLQTCLQATISNCIYCNHARKIAVNGKQLALHAIAEHRFSAIVNSITAEELIPESFVSRLKESFTELDAMFFNLESSEDAITFSHVFECFQCRFSTSIHKELYLHNRKMHTKSILLCIMCKSNFYSYSELICHLCPGAYIDLNNDIHFRCCLCVSDELPSAFRLMVHLRKRHHACDVCLELCHNQSKLSNHVWKHKLHHLCYRCGIAYRNKPDITKHLFWKHGTESVLCKKCLQKKWPHVYHFCIPPPLFTCEECNLSFSKSVSLRVHKRLHSDEKPHSCTFENCTEKFISKKLLNKHDFKHREPIEIVKEEITQEIVKQESQEDVEEETKDVNVTEQSENPDEKPKPKVDVYDLPALNLSESDTSDSEDESKSNVKEQEPPSSGILEASLLSTPVEQPEKIIPEETEADKPVPILENIWDDFKNYQANKEKLDNTTNDEKDESEENNEPNLNVILNDHDYCARTNDEMIEAKAEVDTSVDHDYCTQPATDTPSTHEEQIKPVNNSKKKANGSSSDSSSGSDSSSCTCGSNCSCSSSSGSSSTSSDSSDSDSSTSEGRRRQQQAKRERKKEKAKNKNKESENVDVTATENIPQLLETPIHESDLETTESDTDEEFYDKHPQKLASKLIEEKRNQLLAGLGPFINGSTLENSQPPTPNLPEEEVKLKKKAKYKKRKKKKSSKYENEAPQNSIISSTDYQYFQHNIPSVSIPVKNSPSTTPAFNSPIHSTLPLPLSDLDTSLRSSKRKRVPNKFYGYSSDEEAEKMQHAMPKWRKMDLPSPRSPMVVPTITIKTLQPPPPPPPPIEPISIRTTSTPGELRVQPLRPPPMHPPYKIVRTQDSGSDSNESSTDEKPPIKEQPALYCYCRCPYDEVSEMIGCDSNDCAIEWFHFECVGIMVPPKGQWFCPDCRKKKQLKRELLQQQQQPS